MNEQSDLKGFISALAHVPGSTPTRIVLVGPPGSNHTMIVRRVRAAMAPIQPGYVMYESSGNLTRSLRAPHYTCSVGAILEEVTLSHGGIMFLDEFGLFATHKLRMLGNALNLGLSQLKGIKLSAAPKLVIGSMEACPCGYAGSRTKTCECKSDAIVQYWFKMAEKIGALGVTSVYSMNPTIEQQRQMAVMPT